MRVDRGRHNRPSSPSPVGPRVDPIRPLLYRPVSNSLVKRRVEVGRKTSSVWRLSTQGHRLTEIRETNNTEPLRTVRTRGTAISSNSTSETSQK